MHWRNQIICVRNKFVQYVRLENYRCRRFACALAKNFSIRIPVLTLTDRHYCRVVYNVTKGTIHCLKTMIIIHVHTCIITQSDASSLLLIGLKYKYVSHDQVTRKKLETLVCLKIYTLRFISLNLKLNLLTYNKRISSELIG